MNSDTGAHTSGSTRKTAASGQGKTVTAYAPGKAVLAGEYAVLAGAPALIMAVNRFAHCTISTANSAVWTFSSAGFEGKSEHSLASLFRPDLMTANDPARLLGWVLNRSVSADQHQQLRSALPTGARVHTDTRDMYQGVNKLGLGSSAALITAIAGSIAQLTGAGAPTFQAIHDAHQASQGGVGSGLDIATSLAGGLIRFENGQSIPALWPANLHYRFVYSGHPASTSQLVVRFRSWRESAQKSRSIGPLTDLFDAAATLANRAINLDNIQAYIQALRKLDAAAQIGIYSPEHKTIAAMAEQHRLLYKPCGAGGGDLGVAISDSLDALHEFSAAIGKNFAVIDLEIASNGLKIG